MGEGEVCGGGVAWGVEMSNVIRKIFAKDIDRALTDARADERTLTEEDCEKRYEEQMIRTTGEYELKLKEIGRAHV